VKKVVIKGGQKMQLIVKPSQFAEESSL